VNSEAPIAGANRLVVAATGPRGLHHLHRLSGDNTDLDRNSMCRPQGVLPHTFCDLAVRALDVSETRLYLGKLELGADRLPISAAQMVWGSCPMCPRSTALTVLARLTVEAPSGHPRGRMQGEQVPKALFPMDVGWTSGSRVGRSPWPRGTPNLSHSARRMPFRERGRAQSAWSAHWMCLKVTVWGVYQCTSFHFLERGLGEKALVKVGPLSPAGMSRRQTMRPDPSGHPKTAAHRP
jgi:hypothetical protein